MSSNEIGKVCSSVAPGEGRGGGGGSFSKCSVFSKSNKRPCGFGKTHNSNLYNLSTVMSSLLFYSTGSQTMSPQSDANKWCIFQVEDEGKRKRIGNSFGKLMLLYPGNILSVCRFSHIVINAMLQNLLNVGTAHIRSHLLTSSVKSSKMSNRGVPTCNSTAI